MLFESSKGVLEFYFILFYFIFKKGRKKINLGHANLVLYAFHANKAEET